MKPLWVICFFLLSCAPAFSTDEPPPVYLSHFWIALDQETYDALRTSKEIAALGAVEERQVVAGSEHWSGFYWTARQTYMEFFGAGALPEGNFVGDCGIGLSVETQGGVAAVAERLRTVFGDGIEIDQQVRTTATGDIPWYRAVDLDQERQTTSMWVMELDPGYLVTMHPGSPVSHPLSREQERSWVYRTDQDVDNVVGLTLALNEEQTTKFATAFGLFGWSVHRKGAGFFAVGPDVKIRVTAAGARTGIKQVELRLHRSVPKQRIRLGHAELRLAGNAGRLVLWN